MKQGLSIRREVALQFLLCGAFAGSIGLLANAHPGPPGLWPANGFLVAALFLGPPSRAPVLTLAAVLLEIGLLVVHGLTDSGTVLHALSDGVECLTASWLLRGVLGPKRMLRTPVGYLKVHLLVVLPACVLAAACFLGLTYGVSHVLIWPTSQRLLLSHVIGMATVLPAMLLLTQPALPDLRRSWRETAAILGGVALLSVLVLHQAGRPAVVITPVLLFAAFRLGPRGAAVCTLILTLLAIPVVIAGDLGPAPGHGGQPGQDRILGHHEP